MKIRLGKCQIELTRKKIPNDVFDTRECKDFGCGRKFPTTYCFHFWVIGDKYTTKTKLQIEALRRWK